MNDYRELNIKLEYLEQENKLLKEILNGLLQSDSDMLYAYKKSLSSKSKSEIKIENPLNLFVKSHDYISKQSDPYHSLIFNFLQRAGSAHEEKDVIYATLEILLLSFDFRSAYFAEVSDAAILFSSCIRENSGLSFSYRVFSFAKKDFGVDFDILFERGFFFAKRSETSLLFSKIEEISGPTENLLLIPIIIKSKISGILIVDITGIEEGITAEVLVFLQTVSNIVTLSLRRITYESGLREKKELYELFVENTFFFVFQTLPDGTITFANKKFIDFCNGDSSSFLGQNIKDIFHGETANRIFSEITGKRHKVESEIEVECLSEKRVIKVITNPVFNEAGYLILLNFLGEDITEKRYLEENLLKTKERLELVFAATNDAYWDANLFTGEFFYSSNFYRMLDYESSDMPSIFREFLKLVHPDDLSMIKNIVRKAIKGEVSRTTFRFRARSFFGDYKWLLTRAMVIKSDEKGRALRVVGSNVDITQIVRFEERLKENETRLKGILDNMPIMLLAIDEKGDIIHWNRECEIVTGYSAEEIIYNKNAWNMLFPEKMEGKLSYKVLLEYGSSYRNVELVLTGKDGGKKYVLWSNLSAMYPVSEWFSWSVGLDVTELKKTELELLKAKEKAERSDKLKSAFLANMSHEARTPLNSILGFADLLCENDTDWNDKKFYAKIIRESSKQLVRLISDIIDISKIDANVMVINKKPVHINQLMEHIFEIFRKETENKNIELRMELGLKPPADYIVTDEIRVRQILTNLLGNAVKFTDEGYVYFGYNLSEDKKFLEFYVEDTGPGIAKNKQKIIFGRFRQADSSISKRYGGTGLGLSISKELCRLLGGKIWLRSDLGKGATFYFKIPYELSDAQVADNDASYNIKTSIDKIAGKKILIIDDSSSVHILIEGLLKKENVKVLKAATGKDALEIMSQESDVDIVLMDIQLPDIDGVQLLQEVRGFYGNVPVIAQTANVFDEDRDRFLTAGFDGFLPKPFGKKELLEMLSAFL
ncbi:MAG TPA: ATP-binding protein [Spirochaetota bacterium]|nr:ATP-binding protein [Spirochaetota bacterium]